ncbi:MAG: FtsW/RodA/SpoVE family cell cycle protein [Candidatus Cloacimonadaceae bacterium]|nr:FtsW/RodA/SpoVE family cell cycle protein [Candidatus Cloacimonadaceae bacterium]
MKRTKRQSYITSYDKGIFLTYLALSLAGLLVMLDICSVYSSLAYFYKQLVFFITSIFIVLFILYYFDLQRLKPLVPALMYLTLGVLVFVLLRGTTVKGATRQLSLGFISFQPSFMARIALVFLFAKVIDEKLDELRESKLVLFIDRFRFLIAMTLITFVLIILQRHLSTLIIGGLSLMGMLFYAGLRKRIVIFICVIGILAGVVILKAGAEYRSSRIDIYKKYSLFIRDPEVKLDAHQDYQVRESLTALSSGGLMGTGPSRGRAKHFYLPEARTDYVYTIIGEEFGFMGGLLIFGLHCLLFFRAFKVANAQENNYLKYLCAGLAMNIFFNALVNTGVAMSILPSTGNTLPFISYSGSALLTDSASIGVILNISAKRKYV